jgi:hypothetical protein
VFPGSKLDVSRMALRGARGGARRVKKVTAKRCFEPGTTKRGAG